MKRILLALTLIGTTIFLLATHGPTQKGPNPYQCSTDSECVAECLARTTDRTKLDECYEIFISKDNYDLLERREAELMWKHEAY